MKITPAEMQVLEHLWTTSPQVADEVIAALGPANSWSPATIRTLIGRLVQKGAVAAELQGRLYAYRPLISREDYEATESESLIDRLFAGEVAPMVAGFTRRRPISAADLEALKAIVQELEQNRDKR